MQEKGALRFFILDPTFAIVLMLTCLIGGLLSYTSMVRENNPDLAIPQATISVIWIGASPDQVEEELVKPIEVAIRGLPGLKSFSSSAFNSAAIVAVQFKADVDIPSAMQALRTKVAEAQTSFPKAARSPQVEQISVNDSPIMTYVIRGDVDDFSLNQAAGRLQRELQRVEGVRRANLQGDRARAVHVRLDPALLRSHGLTSTIVQERIEASNQDLSWGFLESTEGVLPLYLQGRFQDLQDIRDIPVYRDDTGRVVRLNDLGEVYIGLREKYTATQASIDGTPFANVISMSVLKRPGGDTLQTIESIRTFVDEFTVGASWPQAITVEELSSESEIIEASFWEVQSNLIQGVAAVFLVLLIALTWREAMVAAMALPVTLLAALMILDYFGYTLNTLAFLGMVIALGILVDVFILVMEGMHEGIYVRGEKFAEAAKATVRNFLMPAISGQATTILAMVPLMTIAVVEGKFIRIIPFTAIACLVASLAIAFLVCIPMSRFFLGRGENVQKTTVDKITEYASDKLNTFLIKGPLKTRWRSGLAVSLALGAFAGSIFLATELEQIVYPKEDRRSLGISVELRPDATFSEAEAVASKVGEALRELPYFSSVVTHSGERSPLSLNSIAEYLQPLEEVSFVGFSVQFLPKSEREKLAFEYLPEIRAVAQEALADIPGAVLRLTPDLGGSSSVEPIQIEITAEEIGTLRDVARDIRVELAQIEGVTDIRDTLGAFKSQARFTALSEALSFYELSEADLLSQIRASLTADKIGTFSQPGSLPDLDIILGVSFPSRNGDLGGPTAIHELESLSLITERGERVPFVSLVDVELDSVPLAIVHAEGDRAVTVKAHLEGEITSADVVARLAPILEEVSKDWPLGTSYRFRGEVESSAQTYSSAGKAFAIALLLVFAILAMLFSSFKQPIIIMAMAPLAMTGVFTGFWLLSIPMSFAAMIGIIALVGIIVNDSIVMVEVINHRLEDGMDAYHAAAHGASDRLRPILTTSITTIVGLTPLALSSPAWYPLCMAIILGLALATILALIVVPSLYVLLSSKQQRQQIAAQPA